MGMYTQPIKMQIKASLLQGSLVAMGLPLIFDRYPGGTGGKYATETAVRVWIAAYRQIWIQVQQGNRVLNVNELLFMQMMPIVQEHLAAHEFEDDENGMPNGSVFELVFS